MILTRLRSGAFGLLAALAISAYIFAATLKVTIVVTLTAVVVMVPGTKGTTPFSTEEQSVETAILQQELSGWVYDQATDGWVTNCYPRSMGLITGLGDPLFDASIGVGGANLDTLISAHIASGVIGFGYSQGATVQTLWLNDHANGKDQHAPSADKLSFVMIGSPNRPNGGVLARIPGIYVPFLGVTFNGATPESQYKTTDVMRQYDLFGDFPVDPLNVFSLLNAIANAGAIHGDYVVVDTDDPNNWVEVDGNTTYIMAPAKTLPLADALRSFVAKFGRTQTPLVDALEPVLKYLVELGYDRTSQGTPTTFQPGSSIGRFFSTLPQFADAIKQGGAILQSELHPSTVQSPANSQKQDTDPQPDVMMDKPKDDPSVSPTEPKPSSNSPKQRIAPLSTDYLDEPKVRGTRKPGDGLLRTLNQVNRVTHQDSSSPISSSVADDSKNDASVGKRSAASRGSTGHSARNARN